MVRGWNDEVQSQLAPSLASWWSGNGQGRCVSQRGGRTDRSDYLTDYEMSTRDELSLISRIDPRVAT